MNDANGVKNAPRQIALALALLTLLFLTGRILQHFLTPALWAIILTFTTWPVYVRLQQRLPGCATLNASLMTGLMALCLLVPLLWLSLLFQREAARLYALLPGWLATTPEPPAFLAQIPYIGDEVRRVFAQSGDIASLLQIGRAHV
jgi:predicted PurR-regulated permease PerM